ncbi:uncharacterized protein RBU57_011161 [Macrochelys suwanniensis]
MTERGHDQGTLQCRVKVKELQNAYHKAREANHHSGAAPTSCQFYKELDRILGGDPTFTAKATVGTLVARMPVESGSSKEEEILDEERVVDPEAEDELEVRNACSQELFSTRRSLASHSSWSLVKRKQKRRPLIWPGKPSLPLCYCWLNGYTELESSHEELKRTFCVMS